MDNQIEEVKSKIDIVALISESVSLKKAGRNYKGLCPFHGEKTPSFMVSPERQIFKCFGCGEGGDSLAFVEKNEKVGFPEALKILANRAGVTLKQVAPDPAEKLKEEIFKINSLAAELYQFLLTKHKRGQRALDYLKARGINEKSIKDFGLGYAPEVDSFASDYFIKKGFNPRDLVSSGMILPSQRGKGWYDRFRARITFPIRDSRGRVVGFSARALGASEPKYLNSPDTLVFNKSQALFGIDLARGQISKEKRAILVEGNLDVVSSHQIGVTNVVAPLGTALTEPQLATLKRFAPTIILSFDTDSAGVAAAKRGIDLAENQGLEVKVADLGDAKDPDELIKKDPQAWRDSIEKATPVYDFLIAAAVKRWSGGGAEGKRKAINEVLPYLKSLTDPILKEHYLDLVSARVGTSLETLQKLLLGQNKEVVRPSTEIKTLETTEAGVEEYLLALILAQEEVRLDIDEALFQKLENRDLFVLIKKTFEREGKLKVKSFLNKVPEALVRSFDEILLQDVDEGMLDNPDKLKKEIELTYNRIRKARFKRKLEFLTLQIKQAEAAKDTGKAKELTKQFSELSTQLSALDQVT
ncbi:MAG: DNA primase [bacterium]|nr:DNA primase [bacterium]